MLFSSLHTAPRNGVVRLHSIFAAALSVVSTATKIDRRRKSEVDRLAPPEDRQPDESWKSVDSKTRGRNIRRKLEVARRQSSRFDIPLHCEIVMMKAPETSGFLAFSFVGTGI